MPQTNFKVEDAVRAVSQAVATVLKFSSNATFVGTCLSRLQASSPAEAEHRVALHLWSILHRHQGASIPLEIAHELTRRPLCQDQLSVRLYTCRDDDAAEDRPGSGQGNDSPAELFMDDGRDDLLFKLATSDLRMHSTGGTTAAHIAPQPQPSPSVSALNAQDAHTPVSPLLLQSHRPRGNGEQSLLSDDVLIVEQADKEGVAGPSSPDEDKEEILRGGIAHDSQGLLQDVSALGSSWGSLSARVLCDPTPSESSLQFSRLDCLEESQLMADFLSEEEDADLPAADDCNLESYCQSDSKERIDQALYLLSQTPTTSQQEEAYANTKRLMERALADLSESMAEDDPAARKNPWWCPLPSQQVEPQTLLPDMGNSSLSLSTTKGSESVSLLRDLDMRQEENSPDVVDVHESDFEDNDYDGSCDFDGFKKGGDLKSLYLSDTQTNLCSENGQVINTDNTLSTKNYNDDYEWGETVCSDIRRVPLGTHAADTYHGKSGDNQVAALPSASVAPIEINKVVPAIKYTHANFLDVASLHGRPCKEAQRDSRFQRSAFSTGIPDASTAAAHENKTREWQGGGTASSRASPCQLSEEGQVSEEENSESLLKGVVFESITGFPIERPPSQEPN
ncbi:uncharacterized protein LOC125044454 [Penaeus chinensis]|uniref:uncharacterized protein LOC125044454 n=1 Tax=Penaeus chinensis TaxID=139456 RepID=UPI001FB5FBFF|nr:uncharacterized protein LOC125044454 [Penaeus chinensis]